MKRSNNFGNNVGKKFKPDPALDDLWGDDPDADDLEDCIFRATQVCEVQESEIIPENISIAPSYSAFHINKPVTSTQANLNDSFNFTRPNNAQNDDDDLEQKLRKLQTNFEAKEGEVSILRMQLKHTKETLEAEHTKKQKDIKDQLQITLKEKEEVSTMLDMKNLEIANLKRRLLDVTKQAAKEMMTQSASRSNVVNSTQLDKVKENNDLRIDLPLCEKIYPLKRVVDTAIFKIIPEERMDLVDIFSDSRHLSITIQAEDKIERIKAKPSGFKMDDIYPDIAVLLNSDEWELKFSAQCNKAIGKIAVVILQLLDDIVVYLENVKLQMKEDRIRRYDLEYLSNTEHPTKTDLSLFNPQHWCPEERGIHCRQLLAVLAEVLSYNNHLQHLVMDSNGLLEHRSMYAGLSSLRNAQTFVFLYGILETVKLIGQMRKAYEFCGFLSAVCHFLMKIFQLQDNFYNDGELHRYFQQITREVIFSRPSPIVLHQVMLLFSNISDESFVEALCNFRGQNALVKKSKKDIYLINKDCCTFQVFSILYKECIWRNGGLDINKCTTVLKFICSAFNVNAKWLYFHTSHISSHSCLCEIYILAVEVVSIVLRLRDTGQIMKNALELSVKTMQMINFKYYDLLERKTDHYLQYKMNVLKLLEKCNEFNICDNDVIAMEKLLTSTTDESQNMEELETVHTNRLFENL